jgi:hypothetical protein
MSRLLLLFVLLCTLVGSAAAAVNPPVLIKKEATKWDVPPAGLTVPLDMETSTSFTLFIPEGFTPSDDGTTTLTVHFLGAAWWMAQEHTRRGVKHPLLTCNAKEGDAAFENDVLKPGVFRRVLEIVQKRLVLNGAPAGTKVARLEVTSFSGGYSGARGLLLLPDVEPMITTLMLNDSLYIGDAKESTPENRLPRMEGLQPFIEFARKARAGERTFLFEHSSTPSLKSVGPKDCSRAILKGLDIPINEVAPDSIPAARSTADFPLLWRADAGNAHFWCYKGENVAIHLAHVRNQANHWKALEGLTPLEIVPPPMPKRPIKESETPIPGTQVNLDLGTTYTLYLPEKYKVPKDGEVELAMHFHGAVWFAIQEHLRRGLDGPLVVLYAGEGSSVYKRQFDDPARFRQVIEAVVAKLKEQGAPDSTHISSVGITSFSAGYGAVREIVKVPDNLALIKRIVLADSLYGSLDEAALARGERIAAAEHVEPWAIVARRAMKGEMSFVITTSDIETPTYAGTWEVARALVKSLGFEEKPLAPGSIPAAEAALDYPLRARTDSGAFHCWNYSGKDAVVHMTLARHVADLWIALDEVGDP